MRIVNDHYRGLVRYDYYCSEGVPTSLLAAYFGFLSSVIKGESELDYIL